MKFKKRERMLQVALQSCIRLLGRHDSVGHSHTCAVLAGVKSIETTNSSLVVQDAG